MALPITTVGTGDNRLIMLHPFPANRTFFDRLTTFLPSDWQALFPDLPGFGQHPSPAGEMVTMEEMAQVIVTQIGGGNGLTVVGGVSMGGYVTMAVEDLFPNYADAYLLANTRDGADGDGGQSRKDAVRRIQQGERKDYLDELLPKLLGSTSLEKQALVVDTLEMLNSNSDQAICQSLLGMGQRPDRSEIMEQVKYPILLITANEDVITGPDVMEDMNLRYRNSELKTIQNAGHYALWEQPDACSSAIYQFLKQLTR